MVAACRAFHVWNIHLVVCRRRGFLDFENFDRDVVYALGIGLQQHT